MTAAAAIKKKKLPKWLVTAVTTVIAVIITFFVTNLLSKGVERLETPSVNREKIEAHDNQISAIISYMENQDALNLKINDFIVEQRIDNEVSKEKYREIERRIRVLEKDDFLTKNNGP
uniref:Uncharacterized protein n=1 Tax=viral metagenome TaxID=1070528 RepID=A0A6M3J3G2_9ZZZZ